MTSPQIGNHVEITKARRWTAVIVAAVSILVALGFLYVAKKYESSSVGELKFSAATVGKLFADFQYSTLAQRSEHFYGFANKIVIVNFWASWCGPCLEEIPSLMALSNKYGERIHIIAISADNGRQDLDVFLKAFPHFENEHRSLIWDSTRQLRQFFLVSRFPETFIFDRNHILRQHAVGAKDWQSADITNFIESLLRD